MGADRLLRQMWCGCLVSSAGSRPRRHLTNEARWQRVATPAAAGLHVTRVRRIPDGWRVAPEGVRGHGYWPCLGWGNALATHRCKRRPCHDIETLTDQRAWSVRGSRSQVEGQRWERARGGGHGHGVAERMGSSDARRQNDSRTTESLKRPLYVPQATTKECSRARWSPGPRFRAALHRARI